MENHPNKLENTKIYQSFFQKNYQNLFLLRPDHLRNFFNKFFTAYIRDISYKGKFTCFSTNPTQ